MTRGRLFLVIGVVAIVVVASLIGAFLWGWYSDDGVEFDEGAINLDPVDLAGTQPFLGGAGEYVFGVEEVVPEDFKGDIPGWFADAAGRGIGVVGVDLVDITEASMRMNSSSLAYAGFRLDGEMGDIYPEILEEAKKNNISVIVMIEAIAHVIDHMFEFSENIIEARIAPALVKGWIRDISATAAEHGLRVGITEEAFPENYMDAIDEACQEYGVTYIHFFEDLKGRPDMVLSEDYSYYPLDARGNAADVAYLKDIWTMGSYYGELGHLNVMFGSAAASGTESGVLTAGGWGMGAKTHQNIAVMRAVQYNPRVYFFVVATGDEDAIYPDEPDYVSNYDFKNELLPLLQEYGKRATDAPKPIANLVLDEPPVGTDEYDQFLDTKLSSASAITNSMLAAGYDIVVTKSEPYASADLYYVLSDGVIWEVGDDLPSSLADLVDGTAPVYYQVAGSLPQKTNWNKVTDALDIIGAQVVENEVDESFFEPIPATAAYVLPGGSYDIPYGGYSMEFWQLNQAGKFSVGHVTHYIEPAAYSGDVLVKGLTAKDGDEVLDDETGLIVRKGNVHFVNGGFLHLGVSPALANIMAQTDVYNTPSYGYLTNGADRSAFFAPYDTDIDVNLLGGTNITVFDENGAESSNHDLTIVNGRLTGNVGRFELVVVT